MIKRTFILLSLLFCLSASAQTPWHTVDSLVKAKAYADAYTLLQQNYAHAKSHGQSYDLLRAAYGIAEVGKKLPGEVNTESLMRRTLPYLDPVEKALCHTLLAKIYSIPIPDHNPRYISEQDIPDHNDANDTVYEKWNRERLSDSVLSHSMAALSKDVSLLLQSRSMADYMFLFTHDTVCDYSPLTLYEAIAYAAVHNIEGSTLLFNDIEPVYSDSMYNALCNPFALASMPIPQGGTPLYKLMALKNVAKYLISTGTDTCSVQWQTLCRELRGLVDHYSGAYHRNDFFSSRVSPFNHIDIHPTVACNPESGSVTDCSYFYYSIDSAITLYFRILPSIDGVIDTTAYTEKLRFALSQPVLHDFAVQVTGHGNYPFPTMPSGDYGLLVAQEPFPTSLDMPDSCLPSVYYCPLSYHTFAIEDINGSNGQGLLLNTVTGEPLAGVPVTMQGKLEGADAASKDRLTLTVSTDTLGRFDFSSLLPEGKRVLPTYSATYHGDTVTIKTGRYISNKDLRFVNNLDYADTVVSFIFNAPVYRFSDTVHFTVTAQQATDTDKAPFSPVPHCPLRVDMMYNYCSDSITSLYLTTDDMGWAEGSIVLSKVMDAEKDYGDDMCIIVYNPEGEIMGRAGFSVDNYTLPTLSLTLNSTSDTHRYGQPVYIDGSLTSRSGAAVAPSKVSYTLWQGFDYAPWTRGIGNEHSGGLFVNRSGELPVYPDGTFSFNFTPVRYDYLPYRDGEYTKYYLKVTATDPTGETATEEIVICVGDYIGSLSLTDSYHPIYDIINRWKSTYIDGLADIHVHCKNLDDKKFSTTAQLTIKTDEPNPVLVWQGEISIPDKSVPLNELVPPVELPDGHLCFILTSDNPRLYPDTLKASHLGFNAPMPLDSLTLFASIEREFYQVGDTLRVRVGSTKKVSAMLLISHGDSIILLRHLRIDKGFTHIALPVEESWAGGTGIAVIAYHNGERISGGESISVLRPFPSLKMHWIEPEGFNLTPPDSDFLVQKLYAGAPVHWRLRITDMLGNPVQTTLALSAYDDAINQLDSYSSQTCYYPLEYNDGYYKYFYCGFEQKTDRLYLKPLKASNFKEKKQEPFFKLRLPNSYNDRYRTLSYYDKPKVEALLSVGTVGYDVLYCYAATIEETDNSWEKIYSQARPQGVLRTDLSPYGLWFGNLRSDRDGILDLRFNAPQRLARWSLNGIAMDRQGLLARIGNTFLTYRDVMLMPNVPPFLYEGDSTSMTVRVDCMDGATTNGIAVRLYDSKKTQGRWYSETLPAGATQVHFPLEAPRTLLPFASRHRDLTLVATDPLHDDIILDTQTARVNLLRRPRLHGNTHPLTASDYRTLQSRATELFKWEYRSTRNVQIIFDSLYCAAVSHNSHATDSLLQVLDKLQLPGGGWPCLIGQTNIFNESAVGDNLNTIMLLQKECPHVSIPQSFNIKRTLQLYDSLMYVYWKIYPKSKSHATDWMTLHDYFAQYPLDSTYFPMRDSLYKRVVERNPSQWDILLLHRHGDTALSQQLAKNLVQSSFYDPDHPEQGRQWKNSEYTAGLLLLYINIFEEVLHDTVLADQVRQRIHYLLPTTVWNAVDKARLTSNGYIRDPHWYKQLPDGAVTLTRKVTPCKASASSASPYAQYTIQLQITLDRPMSHLLIRSPNAACFSSNSKVKVVASTTGNTAAISIESLDSRLGTVATQFAGAPDCLDIYIKRLPAGTHTLEYTVTTDRTGRFLLPPATVQCLAIPWNETKKGLLQASTSAETLTQ